MTAIPRHWNQESTRGHFSSIRHGLYFGIHTEYVHMYVLYNFCSSPGGLGSLAVWHIPGIVCTYSVHTAPYETIKQSLLPTPHGNSPLPSEARAQPKERRLDTAATVMSSFRPKATVSVAFWRLEEVCFGNFSSLLPIHMIHTTRAVYSLRSTPYILSKNIGHNKPSPLQEHGPARPPSAARLGC